MEADADAEMGRRGCDVDLVRRERTVLANIIWELGLYGGR